MILAKLLFVDDPVHCPGIYFSSFAAVVAVTEGTKEIRS
jgi:hypothetical protein